MVYTSCNMFKRQPDDKDDEDDDDDDDNDDLGGSKQCSCMNTLYSSVRWFFVFSLFYRLTQQDA